MATPPQLPLEFVEVEEDESPTGLLRDAEGSWSMVLGIDQNLIQEVQVTRKLYQNGKLLTRSDPRTLEVEKGEKNGYGKLERQGIRLPGRLNSFMVLPFQPEVELDPKGLKPGIYTGKIIAQWNPGKGKGQTEISVRVQQWVRFQAQENKQIRMLTLQEYSGLVAEMEIDFDKHGNPMLSYRGSGSEQTQGAVESYFDKASQSPRVRIGEDSVHPMRAGIKNSGDTMDPSEIMEE